MKTRFDLEQQILDCWNVTNDIETVLESLSENKINIDQVPNILRGIKDLYQLKFDRTFATFESVYFKK